MDEKAWVESVKQNINPVLTACDTLAGLIASGTLTKDQVEPHFKELEKQLDAISGQIKERRSTLLEAG